MPNKTNNTSKVSSKKRNVQKTVVVAAAGTAAVAGRKQLLHAIFNLALTLGLTRTKAYQKMLQTLAQTKRAAKTAVVIGKAVPPLVAVGIPIWALNKQYDMHRDLKLYKDKKVNKVYVLNK
jgi:hypothetical protein